MAKQEKRTIEEQKKHADLMGGMMLVILTLLSIYGLRIYLNNPAEYAFIFGLSACWIIHAILHLLTFSRFRNQDPYKIHYSKWENGGRIYRLFGVKLFRMFLFYSPFRLMSMGIRIWTGREDIERVLREINMAEKSHKVSFTVSVTVIILLFFFNYTYESFYLLICIIPFHVYPIMLQRWNRGRILRLYKQQPPE